MKFWETLENISAVITLFSIVTLLASTRTWWMVRQENRMREKYDPFRNSSMSSEGFLIIGPQENIGPLEVEVKNFIRDNVHQFRGVTDGLKDEHICTVATMNSVGASHINDIVRDVNDKYHDLRTKGCEGVNLFIRGPVAIGAFVGALMKNQGPVRFWHYSGGKYEDWGLIDRKHIKQNPTHV